MAVTINDETTESDIELKPGTVILASGMAGYRDLMYSLLTLEDGQSVTVPAFFPNDQKTGNVVIDVTVEQSEADGKTYEFFVCAAPALGEIHYVTPDGELVGLKLPDTNVTVQLQVTPE